MSDDKVLMFYCNNQWYVQPVIRIWNTRSWYSGDNLLRKSVFVHCSWDKPDP